MKAKLRSKGQITIPLMIRRRLGLKEGQELEFDERALFLKATKVVDEKLMRSVLGACKNRNAPTASELVTEVRGKVELP